jgi:predicted Ser/Thr protein kinase
MLKTPHILADRFEIDSLLGQGGMARVYRGTDLVLGRRVAVKVLATNLVSDPQFVARFRLEAQAAASVSHPNLVSVFDTGSEGDVHFIVMEYVEGRTLDETLNAEGPLDSPRAVRIAEAVCSALAAAHARGIIHRDIKPANILLQPDGVVKVMDFGIAKSADAPSLTNAGFVVGTAAYLSPEQARSLPADARSDIYSLGCVLYEMLTGVTPLTGETLVDIAHKLATEEPLPPSSVNPKVPAEIDRIVMRALAKNPADRYQSGLEMASDLGMTTEAMVGAVAWGTQAETVAAATGSSATVVIGGDAAPTNFMGEDTPAVPTAGIAPRQPWHKRRRLLLVTGVLLLVLGAILTLSSLGRRQAPPAARQGAPAVPELASPPVMSPAPPPPKAAAPAQGPSDALVQGAIQRVLGAILAGQGSGGISEKAATDVSREVEKAYEQYSDGDLDDATDATAEAREELRKYYERGEVSLELVNSLSDALSNLETALRG